MFKLIPKKCEEKLGKEKKTTKKKKEEKRDRAAE
jgi:hypothetical protein